MSNATIAAAAAPLFDIGANLGNKAFRDDLPAVLERARDANVTGIVLTGTSVEASTLAYDLAVRHGGASARPALFSTAGIHPHHASAFGGDHTIARLRELCALDGVVAVGECGLDFDRNFSAPADQLRCFEAQLELAAELAMPVFLHERSAHEDFTRILARFRPRLVAAVVHCFTGSEDALRRYVDLDCYVGLTGWLCDERRGSHLVPIVHLVPEHRLLVETDAPYILPRDLAPKPSSRRNEPSFLPHIGRAVANARGVSEADLARTTTENALRFFGLAPDAGVPLTGRA